MLILAPSGPHKTSLSSIHHDIVLGFIVTPLIQNQLKVWAFHLLGNLRSISVVGFIVAISSEKSSTDWKRRQNGSCMHVIHWCPRPLLFEQGCFCTQKWQRFVKILDKQESKKTLTISYNILYSNILSELIKRCHLWKTSL